MNTFILENCARQLNGGQLDSPCCPLPRWLSRSV